MGWLLDDEATQSRVSDTSNAGGAWRGWGDAVGGQARVQSCWLRGSHSKPSSVHARAVQCASMPLARAWPRSDQERVQRGPPSPRLRRHPAPADMAKDPFYQHLNKHYTWHVVGQFVALYLLGGLPALVWAGCLRIVWVYHITWFVNSAAHVWGNQEYNTGGWRFGGGGGASAGGGGGVWVGGVGGRQM